MNSKLYSRRSIAQIASRLRKNRKKIVFTNGCFDILHAGHVEYLERAKKFGDVLILGLNSDASTKRLKGTGRPVNSQKDRARVLAGLASIDYISIFNEDTPRNLIRLIKPHILVKGADWKISSIAGAPEVFSWGGQVKRVRLLKGRSTTNILKKVKRGS